MNLTKRIRYGVVCVLFFIAGCSPQQASPSFDEMKKTLSDAIQTEEGKKALRKVLSEEEFRELLVIEQPEVKQSIESVLMSDEGKEFWKNTFEDFHFTETFAKSMKDQQVDVMKTLMDDASFQKQMEDFFQQPEMQKQFEKLLQTSVMKEQYEKTIEEVMTSPLLKSQWQQLILEAGKQEGQDQQTGQDSKEQNASSEKSSGADQ